MDRASYTAQRCCSFSKLHLTRYTIVSLFRHASNLRNRAPGLDLQQGSRFEVEATVEEVSTLLILVGVAPRVPAAGYLRLRSSSTAHIF